MDHRYDFYVAHDEFHPFLYLYMPMNMLNLFYYNIIYLQEGTVISNIHNIHLNNHHNKYFINFYLLNFKPNYLKIHTIINFAIIT